MGKPTTITFAELRDALSGFGYSLDGEQTWSDRTIFRHPDRPLRIIIPAYKDRERVHDAHLVVVRHFLGESAPADAQQFDGWLEKRGIRFGGAVPVR